MTSIQEPRLPGLVIAGGHEDPFLPHLCAAIHAATEIDMAVAFIMQTGLRLLIPDLTESLKRSSTEEDSIGSQAARIRILTSDYLDVTDPAALRQLMLLAELGADVRVYESAGNSFHMKAYIFAKSTSDGQTIGHAFIGSSNISEQALKHGLEWNYRINHPGDEGFLDARQKFQSLFNGSRVKPLTHAWIDDYEKRRVKPNQAMEPGALETVPKPVPNPVQIEALSALRNTRAAGYLRGLVVMATGLGKTWLAAFDVEQVAARRVLFVAHREEILDQAANTFLRVRPSASIGFYRGQQRDSQVDFLFASVQTLGRSAHLSLFKPQHFDYIIVDEFHHASAPTYSKLLRHFAPAFLLGLTATPDRTDNADILALCDNNLVFESNFFSGVSKKLLVPFHYFGIFDEDVEYKSIPWRNGKFDPKELSNRLATIGRERHAFVTWKRHAQQRTLAFCVSTRHADSMAEYFLKQGIPAAAVYSDSPLSRGEALEKLRNKNLSILFSVDLFNEGVDLPSIDTVMMLRPTESKILFLQQLGRGLRRFEGKDKLVVLDFVANHQSFLHKPQALMNMTMNHSQLAEFAEKAQADRLELPAGCYVNYDLRFIDFLKSLKSESTTDDYLALKESLGYRPTLTEFYRYGGNIGKARREHGSWFEFVASFEDLSDRELEVVKNYHAFLREVETTASTKSYKFLLLRAFQEIDGWLAPPTLEALATRSWEVLRRRPMLLQDLPINFQKSNTPPDGWLKYWCDNPVNAWRGGNRSDTFRAFFTLDGEHFAASFSPDAHLVDSLRELVDEILDYRLAKYEPGLVRESSSTDEVNEFSISPKFSYFPSLKIACGHFRESSIDVEETRTLGASYGRHDTHRHFIARASGNSMDGGLQPIHDQDYLLLEIIGQEAVKNLDGDILAIERKSSNGDFEYLLRKAVKGGSGEFLLRANNSAYDDIRVTSELQSQFRTFARLVKVIDPLEMEIGNHFKREEIPVLFGTEFNPGNWQSGHVNLGAKKAHVLLVTLNNHGRGNNMKFVDYWKDKEHFVWQSQSSTTPQSLRGRSIINHEKEGISLHLFVRENKLEKDKAAAFTYHGKVKYLDHKGSAPMIITFEIDN
jgi:superfamily II DNA or RNA helicase